MTSSIMLALPQCINFSLSTKHAGALSCGCRSTVCCCGFWCPWIYVHKFMAMQGLGDPVVVRDFGIKPAFNLIRTQGTLESGLLKPSNVMECACKPDRAFLYHNFHHCPPGKRPRGGETSFVARCLPALQIVISFGARCHLKQAVSGAGMPFNDTYVSSKFALEGFTECQASYLHKFGIKISLVEPGPIKTDFVNRVEKDHKLPKPDDAYSALTPEFEKVITDHLPAATTS